MQGTVADTDEEEEEGALVMDHADSAWGWWGGAGGGLGEGW